MAEVMYTENLLRIGMNFINFNFFPVLNFIRKALLIKDFVQHLYRVTRGKADRVYKLHDSFRCVSLPKISVPTSVQSTISGRPPGSRKAQQNKDRKGEWKLFNPPHYLLSRSSLWHIHTKQKKKPVCAPVAKRIFSAPVPQHSAGPHQ